MFIFFSSISSLYIRHCEGALVLARSNPSLNSEIASPPKEKSAARNDGKLCLYDSEIGFIFSAALGLRPMSLPCRLHNQADRPIFHRRVFPKAVRR
jgi:hypothetical protein